MSDVSPAWWAVTVRGRAPRELAAFWAAVLGCSAVPLGPDRPDWYRLAPRGARGPFILVQPDPAPAGERHRDALHLDLQVPDLEQAVLRVLALGGTDTGERQTLPSGRIAVLRDPEDHDFVLMAPPPRDRRRPGPG